jgi:hypothetical protein
VENPTVTVTEKRRRGEVAEASVRTRSEAILERE